MKWRISQLSLPPGFSDRQLACAVAAALHCQPEELGEVRAVRRSIDARKRPPRLMVTAEAIYQGKLRRELQHVEPAPCALDPVPCRVVAPSSVRPLVVGAGPAGLMAALALAEAGARPLLIERGEPVADRSRRIRSFWSEGCFTAESNVLFGEGGAGLFSDGKLTSRSKDRPRVRRFLEYLTAAGASPEILVDAEPHVGSDALEEIVPALRRKILDAGGEVSFGARLERLQIEKGAVRGAVVSGEEVRTDHCILAAGHSARDVLAVLAGQGVPLERKPFAVGLRLEVPQEQIDRAQWGGPCPVLGRASFRLTRREEGASRACYTFCMCPGGLVIACASSAGMITTNGMSLSRRDLPFGNAAFLVPVGPADFTVAGDDVLSGIRFQERIEQSVYRAGGSDYSLPAQRLIDYLDGVTPNDLPTTRSCTRARPAQLRGLLPEFVEQTLLHALPAMLRELKGVDREQALLYAAETRSSSPVRILRDDNGCSPGVQGLYPCGEGSGYAGGIVSSGIDGLRIAEAVATQLDGCA